MKINKSIIIAVISLYSGSCLSGQITCFESSSAIWINNKFESGVIEKQTRSVSVFDLDKGTVQYGSDNERTIDKIEEIRPYIWLEVADYNDDVGVYVFSKDHKRVNYINSTDMGTAFWMVCEPIIK